MRVLLLGNPNAGKSVVFNRLTGVNVISSNYPGTTVEFTEGSMLVAGEPAGVIDVPGTYSLEPTCKAEEVARDLLAQTFPSGDSEGPPAVVVNVVDATNLERSLPLTLQLVSRGIPMVVCLNLWDETKHTGVYVDQEKLAEILGVPCVPTCAITGEGIKAVAERLAQAPIPEYTATHADPWQEVGRIIGLVQRIEHKHHTFREWLGDAAVKPVTAFPLAALILGGAFAVIWLVGESLINYIFLPLFEKLWLPLMQGLSAGLGGDGYIRDLLIGQLAAGGDIDLEQSLGLLTTGIYIPLGVVFPYVFAFYLVLSLLEDTGYLPRLAVIMDTLMHRLGMHGMSIVPMMLGFGCNVPGTLASRILETKRERFIAVTVMAITVPCMSQMAMVAGLVGSIPGGPWQFAGVFAAIFSTLLLTAIILGRIFNMVLPGESTELLIDIPPFRVPYIRGLVKKVWLRMWWFVREAIPWMLGGVLFIRLLEMSGAIAFVGDLAAPVVENLLGLPRSAVAGMVVGFLRKDVAVVTLRELGLDWRQVTVSAVVLTMYFPCVATFSVMFKEFGWKMMGKAALIMLITSLTAGTVLNFFLQLL